MDKIRVSLFPKAVNVMQERNIYKGTIHFLFVFIFTYMKVTFVASFQ